MSENLLNELTAQSFRYSSGKYATVKSLAIAEKMSDYKRSQRTLSALTNKIECGDLSETDKRQILYEICAYVKTAHGWSWNELVWEIYGRKVSSFETFIRNFRRGKIGKAYTNTAIEFLMKHYGIEQPKTAIDVEKMDKEFSKSLKKLIVSK